MSLDVERLTAAAGRHRVRVLDREPAACNRLDEIHLGALQIADADGVDIQLDAIRFEHLIGVAAVFLNHEAVLKPRASATLHEYTQPTSRFTLFGKEFVDFGRRCRRHVDHCVEAPGNTGSIISSAVGSHQARQEELNLLSGFDLVVASKLYTAVAPMRESSLADSFSTSLCRLLPPAFIVTIAGKSVTCRCHIASGVPNSISDT